MAEYLNQLLIGVGVLLQYVRAYSAVPEWAYHIVCAVLVGAAWWITQDLAPDARTNVVKFLIWLPVGLSTAWGGTFAASGLAKAGVSAVPKTDSK